MTILGVHFHKWTRWESVTLVSSIPILSAFGHNTERIVEGQKRHCEDCGIEKLRTIGR